MKGIPMKCYDSIYVLGLFNKSSEFSLLENFKAMISL